MNFQMRGFTGRLREVSTSRRMEIPKLPIWGDYLMVEPLEDRGINPKDAVSIVDARIISLVF